MDYEMLVTFDFSDDIIFKSLDSKFIQVMQEINYYRYVPVKVSNAFISEYINYNEIVEDLTTAFKVIKQTEYLRGIKMRYAMTIVSNDLKLDTVTGIIY